MWTGKGSPHKNYVDLTYCACYSSQSIHSAGDHPSHRHKKYRSYRYTNGYTEPFQPFVKHKKSIIGTIAQRGLALICISRHSVPCVIPAI
jgi:hypothetical protein